MNYSVTMLQSLFFKDSRRQPVNERFRSYLDNIRSPGLFQGDDPNSAVLSDDLWNF